MPLVRLLRRVALGGAYRRDESGQAIVIVGLSIVVLIVGLAFGVEWGYGVTQRRVMQNAADGGAIAGAKLLATNVLLASNGTAFRVARQDVYCAALSVVNSNDSFRPTTDQPTIVVAGSSDKITWTTFPAPAGACPAPGNLAQPRTEVPPGTAYVRVATTLTYPGLFGGATGQSTVTAGATAIARITGAGVPTIGFTWPMMRHFHPADFVECPSPCTPLTQSPVTFWSSSGSQDDIVFGSFKALTDYSRYSPNINRNAPPAQRDNCTVPSAACVPQLLQQWDTSGAPPAGKPKLQGNNNACSPPAPNNKWFSSGNEDDRQYDKNCSIPNWTAYSFSGSTGNDTFGNGQIGLDTNWYRSQATGGNLQALQEAPDNAFKTNSRATVCPLPAPIASLPAPSCADPERGDWIETANSGDLGSNAASAMIAYIDAHPSYDEFQHVPTSSGRGAPEFGPYAVISVYLWDCAESFNAAAAPGSQWSLAMPKVGTDCADIHNGNDTAGTIDRVHVLSVAPFTFYRGMVSGNLIQGFWGGRLVTDPGTCQVDPSAPGCAINPFANSVFLVSEN
jgi:Flp pilus assembly protein TadG